MDHKRYSVINSKDAPIYPAGAEEYMVYLCSIYEFVEPFSTKQLWPSSVSKYDNELYLFEQHKARTHLLICQTEKLSISQDALIY